MIKIKLAHLLKLLILTCYFCSFSVQADESVDFSLKDINGEDYTLSDYRKQWVIVNFWATWCTPCIEEIPEFIEFQKQHPEHKILGINFEEISNSDLQKFVQLHNINYPILRVGDTPLIPFEPLKGLPATAIVSPSGELLTVHTGSVTAQALEDFIQKNQ